MNPLGRRGALAALALLVLAVAGCGGTVLDPTKIEAQSEENLENNLPARLAQGRPGEELQDELGISADEKISSVDCPSGVDIEVGNTFDCVVEFANGQTTTETFRIEDEDGNVTQLSLGPSRIDRSHSSGSNK
jgi:hypothetical protein